MNLQSLRLAPKFNLIFIIVSLVGLLVAGWVFNTLLQRQAKEQVLGDARLMMQSALSVRKYTNTQIRPLLPFERNGKFVPQTVPAFSAMRTFEYLREGYPNYFYKEASLNPTNRKHIAADWEKPLLNNFRKNSKLKEIIGERMTPKGPYLYLARPIVIKDPACLSCHTTPAMAPPSQIRQYGKGGFGWKVGDVVAAQVVSVPMAVPQQMARKTSRLMLTSLAVVLLATLLILNVMLRVIVVQPVMKLSSVADEISKGNLEVEDLPVKGQDEISTLAGSFNRMHRSLRQAMKMLDE